MHKLLIIEDDKALSGGISLALQSADIVVAQSGSLKAAKAQLLATNFDLLILDINLPDGSGLALLCEVKSSHAAPVILLTANDMETDIVAGLEMGADDYITKPFSLAVLRARVNTQRKKHGAVKEGRFEQDDLAFDFDRIQFENQAALWR